MKMLRQTLAEKKVDATVSIASVICMLSAALLTMPASAVETNRVRRPLPPRIPPAATNRTANATRLGQLRSGLLTAKLATAKLTAANGPSVVDVLVAYDLEATAWADKNGGGVTNFAADAVARMNQALTNSLISSALEFRLAGVVQVNAVAPTTHLRETDFNAVLEAVTYNHWGTWTIVPETCAQLGADIAVTMIDTGSAYGTTGLSWALCDESYESFADYAFSVCAVQAVATSHTMTHEVGHLLGAGHSDRQSSDPGPLLYDYSSGYYFETNGVACNTIMAYNADGYGNYYEEVPYFSSPTVELSGVPVGTATNDNARTLRETAQYVASFRTPPTAASSNNKPDGKGENTGEQPPDKPDGDGGEGGDTPPGGGSEDSVILTGAYQYTCETNTLAGATLVSATSDQNVILAQSNAFLTVSNCVLNKSGDTSSADNSNFFALNAVVAAKSAAKICIDNSTLNSNAEGANCLFASGAGSTIYAYNCSLTSTKSSSRGLDATYEGTVIASKMTIDTSSEHCAALATDRGNGYISVTDSSLSTAGQGSPLVYSTGVIEVNGVTGTATGAQIAGIEGLSTIRIRNSDLTGSGEKASEPVANGVIIYQSMSGDSTEGTATFEVSDSTLTSEISGGAMFYITHSEAVITVQNADLGFDTANNYLLKAAGNDGSNGWGTAGANGAEVVFTAIDQTLAGNVTVDGISSLDMYLVDSKYTGTFENDTTYTGDGEGIDLFVNSNSIWIVTANCTLKSLTAAPGAKIVDGSGNVVSIVNMSGTKLVSGTGELTITVSAYSSESVVSPHAITAFEIDRTEFEARYGVSEGLGTYRIRYLAGSGTGTMDDQVCERDKVYALSPCAFSSPKDKTFAGWSDSNGKRYDGGVLIFNAAAEGTILTLTAIWQPAY